MTTSTNAKKLLVKTFTKKTTLGKVPDNNEFKVAPRSDRVVWTVILKDKKGVVCNSKSGKSFYGKKSMVVYVA